MLKILPLKVEPSECIELLGLSSNNNYIYFKLGRKCEDGYINTIYLVLLTCNDIYIFSRIDL